MFEPALRQQVRDRVRRGHLDLTIHIETLQAAAIQIHRDLAVAYLRAAESLPWRIQWRKLELTAGEYPVNRVRLVIGALSLSRDWLSV